MALDAPTRLFARSFKDDAFRTLLEKKVFDHTYSANSVIVTLSIALSLYNSLELLLAISTTFKKCTSLYFWSMLLCTFGVMLYAIGLMLMYFELCILWLSKVIIDAGWIGMIVFQSLVLYSRLGLVLDSDKILRAVRWMIIFNCITLVTLTIIFDFGFTYSQNPAYGAGYFYVEHIQVTLFCFQELVISSLYVWKAVDLLQLTLKARTRRTMVQLFIMNVVIIGMDVSSFHDIRPEYDSADVDTDRTYCFAIQAPPTISRKHQGLRVQRKAEARAEHLVQARRSSPRQQSHTIYNSQHL